MMQQEQVLREMDQNMSQVVSSTVGQIAIMEVQNSRIARMKTSLEFDKVCCVRVITMR
jgi:hypothetical protein